jgi:hypothetical protein
MWHAFLPADSQIADNTMGFGRTSDISSRFVSLRRTLTLIACAAIPRAGSLWVALPDRDKQSATATTYVTLFQDEDGKWERGKPVFTAKINGVQNFKTVAEQAMKDNLDELPEI